MKRVPLLSHHRESAAGDRERSPEYHPAAHRARILCTSSSMSVSTRLYMAAKSGFDGERGFFQVDLEDLLDPRLGTGRHHRQVGAQQERLEDVVGDVENGLARLGPDFAEFDLEVFLRYRVQGRERLVHEEDVRVVRQRAGDLDALLHPAREFEGELPAVGVEAHEPKVFVGPLIALLGAEAGHLRAELHVFARVHPWEEGVADVLEDDRPVRSGSGDGLIVERSASRRRPFKAGDDVEEGGFAAPARPEESEERPPLHCQRGRPAKPARRPRRRG